MKFFNYIRYSNIQIAINLNPFTWFTFYFIPGKDEGLAYLVMKVLMFRFFFLLYDGSVGEADIGDEYGH